MKGHDLTSLISTGGSSGTRRTWRCPDDARLAAFVEGTLPAGRRQRVASHLADCAFCRGQVGFLVRDGRADPPAVAVPGHLLARARGEHSFWIGALRPPTLAVAGCTLLLALIQVAPLGRPGALPALPEIPAPYHLVRQSGVAAEIPRITSPVEGQEVAPSALGLQWARTADAVAYTVQIVDPEGNVVWEGRTEATRLAVPPEASLVPGQKYFAWVLAHLRTGAVMRSPAVLFRLAPG